MFLNRLFETNRPLIEYAHYCHRKGTLLPDTYLLDADVIKENALLIKNEADKHGITLYFMLKQIGRIPFIGKMLIDIGYSGAVCVDFREAAGMIENGVPLGHVGHLVQIPKAYLETIIEAKPEIITVYSVEKAGEIGRICSHKGQIQDIMLRVIGDKVDLYPGQYGGFTLASLDEIMPELEQLEGIRIAGVCSFPCIKYDEQLKGFVKTPNLDVVNDAARLLASRGHGPLQLNMPSCTCAGSMALIALEGGTHAEPGHGLTGTTPYHALSGNGPERTAILYLSEISHNLDGKAYCYGGGWYRRGGLENAVVGDIGNSATVRVNRPATESIDYYLELDTPAGVGLPVIMCFRTQIFVTRSRIAVVSGLASGKPEIEGVYSSQGERMS